MSALYKPCLSAKDLGACLFLFSTTNSGFVGHETLNRNTLFLSLCSVEMYDVSSTK